MIIHVEVAADDASRARGLRGRAAPSPMLFDFAIAGRWAMTMRGVVFPLDAVAIRGDGIVVGVVTMPALAPGPFILSDVPYRYVLELPRGGASRIDVGARILAPG